jgi:hypothetical protein
MWARSIALVAALALVSLGACYGGDARLSPRGGGLPEVTVSFPPTAAPGSVHEAVIEVTNPGPGDIGSLLIAFSLVGVAGEGAATPLVVVGARHESPSVVAIRPRPAAVSADGVVYRFDTGSRSGTASEPILPSGESLRIEFDIEVPHEPGPAANSVLMQARSRSVHAGSFCGRRCQGSVGMCSANDRS